MKALFFGAVTRQLYGVYHAPAQTAPARRSAVVLAYPWMAEYNMSHLAFKKLAAALAREGFPTLRFDYFGTGDSMGSSDDATPESGVSDIRQAADEVRELGGASSVSLVGMRLGAALALRAALDLPVRDLILWDPVFSGAAYLDELNVLDARQRLRRLCPKVPARGAAEEIMGYSFSRATRDKLLEFEAPARPPKVSGQISLVVSADRPEYRAYCERLQASGARASMQVLDATSEPNPAEGQAMLFASGIISAITAALAGGAES